MTRAPSLREENAERTRARILDGFAALLVETDAEEISVPEVSRRSGVSLRTIYRYYPTRDDLVDAAGDWIFRRTFGDEAWEEALDDLPKTVAAKGRQWEAHPELARAVANAPGSKALIDDVRRRQRARKKGATR
jgi:AcrR family transcriptional regulator